MQWGLMGVLAEKVKSGSTFAAMHRVVKQVSALVFISLTVVNVLLLFHNMDNLELFS